MRDKDKLIAEMTEIITSLGSKGLSEEEISCVIYQDVLLPAIQEDLDAKAALAFTFKSSKYYQ